MSRTVLYIEDESSNIALVEAMLKRRPQTELQVAMNGRDGVEAATKIQPGLILLDNRLPDATGSQILKELTAAPVTAGIPVVIFSGDSDEAIDQLLASGAADTVAKPFNLRQFMDIIDRYLPLPQESPSG